MPRRRRKHIKGYTKMKGRSTIGICREVKERGIFDFVRYSRNYGQSGAFVEVERGDYEASLRRESWPTSEGYNGTDKDPTRITYMCISKTTRNGNHRCFGFYDPQELIHSPRHNFEKDAEKSPKLKEFLNDVLLHFNGI
ncbi:MAG: hypothetical protein V1818_00570 [Candidatus Aenigmatarchaeota archaeon]